MMATGVIVPIRPWTLPYIHAGQVITQHLVILFLLLLLSLEEGNRSLACAECNLNDTNQGGSLEPAVFRAKLSNQIIKYNLFVKE